MRRLIFLIFLVCLVLVGCAGRPKEAKVFHDSLGDYLKLEARLLPHKSRGYLGPQVVVVDLSTGEVDDEVFMALPPELRAQSPAGVKTVVLIEWRKSFAGGGKNLKGNYTDATFYRWQGFITVVDVSESQPVVSFTECYQHTLPEAYRDAAGGGSFKVVKEDKGWVIETSTQKPRTKPRLFHSSVAGKAPLTGHKGENVGPRPVKEVLDVLLGLPRKKI